MTFLPGFLLAAVSAATLAPSRLEVVKNERLAYVLMNSQVIRETTSDETRAFHIRIIGVPEHGECDGSPDTCPRTELFIAASSIDEYPDQRVYQVGKRHEWRFVRWTHLPDVDAPSEFVEFILRAQDPSPTPEADWWRTTWYDVKVNYREARISERPAGAPLPAAIEPAIEPPGPAELYWLLNRACWDGDEIAVRMLLKAGADPNGVHDYDAFHQSRYQRGFEPSWPINQAARGGHSEVIQLLLAAGARVDAPEDEGQTALIIAAWEGHGDVVRLLLESGADKNYSLGEIGPAEEAARKEGHEDIARLIHDFQPGK